MANKEARFVQEIEGMPSILRRAQGFGGVRSGISPFPSRLLSWQFGGWTIRSRCW